MDKDLKSTTEEDASPLTTSTESETFDTWTVITERSKDLTPDEVPFTPLTPEKAEDDDEDVVTDAVHVEVLKATEDIVERYNDIDDLSDGISIISESESAGRISPHPELRKHLSDLNMRFINVPEPPLPSTTGGSASMNYDACSERSSDTFHQVEPLLESNRKPRRISRQLVAESTDFHPTLRCGLRGLFYLGALLAVIAFISKLKYDAWETVLGTRTGLLTQKIDDLELKHNLMRAEIDILAKQVNYLTTLSENQKYNSKSKNTQTRDNKMKVFPGNGNNIEEVEISPKDLKKPFKCEGHNSVDIAGICLELPIPAGSVGDSLRDKARVVIDETEYLTNFEKVIDKIVNRVDSPFSEQIEKPTETVPTKDDPTVPQPQPQLPKNDYAPHEHKPDSKKYEKRDSYKKHNTKNDSGESKERERSRRDRSNEDKDDSGERHKKSKDHKKYDKRSSKEYENAKREADGQWQEKLMQHRENARKMSEKYRHDKNWFIERGDSREQARVTEQKYRAGGQR